MPAIITSGRSILRPARSARSGLRSFPRSRSVEGAVVAITLQEANGDTYALCSGTLVLQNVVVTVAHCVEPPPVAGETPASWRVFFGSDVLATDAPGSWRDVLQAQTHPAYDVQIWSGHDIAVLLLDGSGPAAPKPMNTVPLDASFTGSAVRIVGFGVSGATKVDGGLKREASTTLVATFDDMIRSETPRATDAMAIPAGRTS